MIEQKKSLQNTYKKLLFLKGHKDSISSEKDIVYSNVEKAKKWINKQPDYLKFLQHVQHVLHEKNIGVFSELLTYFVKDVLNKEKEIKLDLYTYHNLPALRIEASNNGNRESIYEGNGGSIANIVSTGLRLISLSRMNHRKFIILDEPDCWVAPQHIPLFAKIIGEISHKLKIQTILISHHKWEYFKDYGRVIELKKDGPHLTTEILHDTPVEDYPSDYIEEISLKRLMSHYDTTYQLHPYLTCIVGENDIGKSVIAPGMKAVSYGDSSDSYIQHNENEAQVILKSSQNYQILWQRFRETSHDNPQKVKFTLFEEGKNPISEFNSSDCPLFISEKLKIALTEDIDIHIGNQKQPVFLLSSDVKPQERAKILSLGKESLIIQKMMETMKSKKKSNQAIIKEGELKYERIVRQLKYLENTEKLIDEVEELLEFLFTVEREQVSCQELNSFVAEYEKFSLIENVNPIEIDFTIPELKDTDSITEVIQSLEINEKISQLEKCILIEELGNLHETQEIENLIKEYEIASKTVEVSRVDIISEITEWNNTDEIDNIINDLEKLEKISSISIIENHIEIPTLNNIDEISSLIEKLEHLEKIQNISNVEFIDIPELQDIDEINNIIAQYEEALAMISEWEEKGKRLEQWRIVVDQEMKEFLELSGYKCPTCHQTIDLNTMKEHIND